jgi:NAD(P)-dependent dehydrogenase (short-subunit alcohol dehydrogenase family)
MAGFARAEGVRVRDRAVFITGAARGIGLETARQLTAAGARVTIADLDGELAGKEAEVLGIGALGLECDVTDRAQVDAAVAATVDRFGRIDVVIPNAGIGRAGTLSAMSDADYRQVVAVNIDGVWNTVRATIPPLVETHGYLLVMSSAYAFMNGIGVGAYPATKAAVEAMGRAWRVELAADGVDVGIAYFGFIDTDLVRNAFAHPGLEQLRKALPRFMVDPMPVERAGRAILKGIERRAARVSAPGWIGPCLALRGVLAHADRRFSRDARVRRACEIFAGDASP